MFEYFIKRRKNRKKTKIIQYFQIYSSKIDKGESPLINIPNSYLTRVMESMFTNLQRAPLV